MFRSDFARTGIDLGSSCIKLVRGSGTSALSEITHIGYEPWKGDGDMDVDAAARALRVLLDRLHLNRTRLGRIAVSVGGADTCIREVEMPPLTPDELRQALPFESRQHLDLSGMEDPVIDCQHLGTAPSTNGGGDTGQIRVLFAGAPRTRRDFPVQVLKRVGLEPEVVDFETLAALNELLANHQPADDGAIGLVDLGTRRHDLHIVTRNGGLFTRLVGEGTNGDDTADDETWNTLISNIRGTFTYYRGRRHTDVTRLYVGGGHGGGDLEALESELGIPVSEHDPFSRLGHAAIGRRSKGLRDRSFVIACGLCRWWDTHDV